MTLQAIKPPKHEGTKISRAEKNTSSVDLLGREVVDCAFQIHKEMGPGLLESVYEECFLMELKSRKIAFEYQKKIPLLYKQQQLKGTFRLDVLVENQIIVELKSVDKLLPLHEAQLLSYLKITNKRLGYLINFNVPIIKEGIKRRVL